MSFPIQKQIIRLSSETDTYGVTWTKLALQKSRCQVDFSPVNFPSSFS